MWGIQGICTFSGKPIGKSISCLDFVVIAGGQPALECKWPAGSSLQLVASSCIFVYITCFLTDFPVSCRPNWSAEVGVWMDCKKKKIAHLILLQVVLKQDPLNCQKTFVSFNL